MLKNCKIIGPVDSSYHDQPQEFNRGEPGYIMSQSGLVDFYSCPAKWKANVAADEDSEAMTWGSMVDCRALTPAQWGSRFAVKPKTYPDAKTGEPKPWNGNSKWCEDWLARLPDGVTAIKQELCDRAMVAGLKAALQIPITCASQVMVTGEWRDKATGLVIPLRGMIDAVPPIDAGNPWKDSLIDLKTSSSAAPRQWSSKVFQSGYDIQAAFYLDLFNAGSEESNRRVQFLHVVQESKEPFQTELYLLSSEWIDLGRQRYQMALAKYCACLKSGVWPGYNCREIYGLKLIEPAPWMLSDPQNQTAEIEEPAKKGSEMPS